MYRLEDHMPPRWLILASALFFVGVLTWDWIVAIPIYWSIIGFTAFGCFLVYRRVRRRLREWQDRYP